MAKVNIDHLRLWVEEYYRKQLKKASYNGGIPFEYYKKMRGYYKVSNHIDELKLSNFLPTDYLLWAAIMSNLKMSHDPVLSGGCFIRYTDYKDVCGETAFYKSRNKFVELGLLIETEFKPYYIINSNYVLKLYVERKDEEVELNNIEKDDSL